MPSRVVIRPPGPKDEAEYLAAVRRSRKLHRPWVSPIATGKAFRAALLRWRPPSEMAFFIFLRGTSSLVGVVTLSEIVRGHFQSAYLSYLAFEPHAGRGLMREGLGRVITHAFGDLGLHRLEANIQPGNRTSRALARALGFRQEGYSPRYLKISGRWKDHERWAILADEWKGQRAT